MSEAATGLVSAIIPVFNGDRYIAEAIESALVQTYSPIEIIVVDDASTDRSAAIASGYPEVTLIRRETNGGVSAARNDGIERASGEYLALLDADDLWRPEKIAQQVEFLRDHPDRDYVLCAFEQFFQMGVPAWFRHKEDNSHVTLPLPSALMCRREAFERIGLFDPAYRHAEDTEWFARAAEAGAKSAMLNASLMRHRIHDANLTGNVAKGRESLFRLLRSSARRKGQPTSPDGAE